MNHPFGVRWETSKIKDFIFFLYIYFFLRSPKPPEIKGREIRINSQSEISTLSNVSMMKQSTPEISRMHMQSPEQSRIVANAGDKFKLETTPVSGFSSIHEKSYAPNMTQPPRRFILSPGKILLKFESRYRVSEL